MPEARRTFSPCLFRSPWARPIWADTTGADVARCLENHPPALLQKIADEGFDGLWLNAIFRTLVPSNLYPHVRPDRLQTLQRLVDRAGKFGVKVHLLLHEPRAPAENDPLWKQHPEIKGQPFHLAGISAAVDGRYPGMCTSAAAVREFLEQSADGLFRNVAGLGGVLLVTASEYHSHCYSHYPIPQRKFAEPDMEAWSKADFVCPRCKARHPIKVVAELIAGIHRGVRRASRDALVMAHTWSWDLFEPNPQRELIGRLPRDVVLLSDWERGGRKLIQGRRWPVDEYSYSYQGPSPRFRQQCRFARRRGMRMMTKLSLNGTHELRSIPYLPVPYLLADKLRRLRQLGVIGYEGFLPFAGEFTPMTKLAGMMSRHPQPAVNRAVRLLAEAEYGRSNAARVCRAWRIFSRAWRHYPFSTPLLYWGPMNYATAYPLKRPVRNAARIPGWLPLPRDGSGHIQAGDNLESWLQHLSPHVVIGCFRRLLMEWEAGVSTLEMAVANSDAEHVSALKREWGLVRHILLSIRSTVNIIRFHRLDRSRAPNSGSTCRQLRRLFAEELATAQEDRALVAADNRLGYHPEAHEHLFGIRDLNHKIRLCQRELGKFARSSRESVW